MWASTVVRLLRFLLSLVPRRGFQLLRICCDPQRGGGSDNLLPTAASPGPLHPWLIGPAYRTPDGVESHRYSSAPFSPGGDTPHPRGPTPITASPVSGGLAEPSPRCFIQGRCLAHPTGRKCRLPKSLCLAPSSPPLLRTLRWDDPSCVPPTVGAGFEQSVLYKRGLAQVGFGVAVGPPFFTSPFYRLSAEPWRLTHPFGVVRRVFSTRCVISETFS